MACKWLEKNCLGKNGFQMVWFQKKESNGVCGGVKDKNLQMVREKWLEKNCYS